MNRRHDLKVDLEQFARRGRAAQEAVDKMTDTTPKVDLVALVKECRMGLSVMLGKEDMDYDPSDQARELIGRVDRIVSELLPVGPTTPLESVAGFVVINGDCGCSMQPVIGGDNETLFMCAHAQINVSRPKEKTDDDQTRDDDSSGDGRGVPR